MSTSRVTSTRGTNESRESAGISSFFSSRNSLEHRKKNIKSAAKRELNYPFKNSPVHQLPPVNQLLSSKPLARSKKTPKDTTGMQLDVDGVNKLVTKYFPKPQAKSKSSRPVTTTDQSQAKQSILNESWTQTNLPSNETFRKLFLGQLQELFLEPSAHPQQHKKGATEKQKQKQLQSHGHLDVHTHADPSALPPVDIMEAVTIVSRLPIETAEKFDWEIVYPLMQLAPLERNAEQIRHLCGQFRLLKACRQMSDIMLRELCGALMLRRLEAGETIAPSTVNVIVTSSDNNNNAVEEDDMGEESHYQRVAGNWFMVLQGAISIQHTTTEMLSIGDTFQDGPNSSKAFTATTYSYLACLELQQMQRITRFVSHLDNEEKRKLLKKVKVFSDWVESQLYALATLASLKVVNSGDVLIREGDDIDTMYFIAAGKCKVTKQVPAELCANQADILTQGKEQVVMLDGVKKTDAANDIIGLGELVKNDYFNECSVVPQQQLIQLGLSLQSADKSPVTVTAVDDGTRLISFSSYDARYKFGSMLQLTEASMTAMDTAQFTSRFQEHLIEQRWRQFKQIEMSRIYAEVLKI